MPCCNNQGIRMTRTFLGTTLAATNPKKGTRFWQIREGEKNAKAISLGSVSCSDPAYLWQALPGERRWYAIGIPMGAPSGRGLLLSPLEGSKKPVLPTSMPLDGVVDSAAAASTPNGIALALNFAQEGTTLLLLRRVMGGHLNLKSSLQIKSQATLSLQLVPLLDSKSALMLFCLSPDKLSIQKVEVMAGGQMQCGDLRTFSPSRIAKFTSLSLQITEQGLNAVVLTNKPLIYPLTLALPSTS